MDQLRKTLDKHLTERQQEAVRWAKEELLPPDNVMESLILETKDKTSKIKCKLMYCKLRKKAGLTSPMDKHEIVHWKAVEKIHIERLNDFQFMQDVRDCMMKFPNDINETTFQARLLFAELGDQFMDKGKAAFKSKLIRVRSSITDKVVIERNPDEDFWLSGVPLDYLDHYNLPTKPTEWIAGLQFKPMKNEILAKKQVLVNLKTDKVSGESCPSSIPPTPHIAKQNKHKRSRKRSRSQIAALNIFTK